MEPCVSTGCVCYGHLQLRKKFLGHRYGVSAVRFSPNGSLLVSCSWDDNIGLWDVQTATLLGWLHGHSSPVANAVFLDGGNILVSETSVLIIVCLSVRPSVCLPVCLPTYLSVRSSTSPHLYLSYPGQLFLGWNCVSVGPFHSLHPTRGNCHTHSSP